MLSVYRQTICAYFALPQVELISSAEFYGDTGRLSKFSLSLSDMIVMMMMMIMVSVVHAMTLHY